MWSMDKTVKLGDWPIDMLEMLHGRDAPPSFSNPEYGVCDVEPEANEQYLHTLDDVELELNPLYEAARDSEIPRHDVEENFRWEVDHLYNFFKRLYAGEHEQLRYGTIIYYQFSSNSFENNTII